MVDRDVVVAKIATIDRCLHRIAEVHGPRRSTLSPLDVEDIISLNLLRAVQAAIDLATHVVAVEGYGLPDTVAGAFSLLEREGVIDADLASRLRKMVGFRNVAIHDYQNVDPAIVESIVAHHLGDLRAFAAGVLQRFQV